MERAVVVTTFSGAEVPEAVIYEQRLGGFRITHRWTYPSDWSVTMLGIIAAVLWLAFTSYLVVALWQIARDPSFSPVISALWAILMGAVFSFASVKLYEVPMKALNRTTIEVDRRAADSRSKPFPWFARHRELRRSEVTYLTVRISALGLFPNRDFDTRYELHALVADAEEGAVTKRFTRFIPDEAIASFVVCEIRALWGLDIALPDRHERTPDR